MPQRLPDTVAQLSSLLLDYCKIRLPLVGLSGERDCDFSFLIFSARSDCRFNSFSRNTFALAFSSLFYFSSFRASAAFSSASLCILSFSSCSCFRLISCSSFYLSSVARLCSSIIRFCSYCFCSSSLCWFSSLSDSAVPPLMQSSMGPSSILLSLMSGEGTGTQLSCCSDSSSVVALIWSLPSHQLSKYIALTAACAHDC